MATYALAALLLAAIPRGEAQDRRVTLTVKPVLCITDRREESCALTILVAWRSDVPGSFCLHNALVETPLQCWERASTGMVVEERIIKDPLRYWLTDGDSETPVAEAELDVLTMESDDRRRHRQRRHVWDIL
jgi:hypothetical protein